MYDKLDDYIGESLTYKQMCETLGSKYQKGNGKDSQLKDIQRYYQLEKVKTKYKIIEKYEEPLEKEDNRRSVFYDDLEVVILYALSEESGRDVNWSVGKSLLLANFVNENFKYCNDKTIGDMSKALEVDRNYMYDFYNISRAKFKKIFEAALKRMERKGLVDVTFDCTMVCKRVPKVMLNDIGEPVISENGKMQYEVKKEYREATKDEREAIAKASKETLKELEVSDTQECFRQGKWGKYRKIMKSKLSKSINIDFYYKGYSIVKNEEYVQETISDLKRDICATSINSKAIKAIKESNNKNYIRDIEDRDILTDYLINENAISIITIIKNMSIADEESDNLPF